MKYTIEASDGICTETLEFPNGDKFSVRNERTECGCQGDEKTFAYQLEKAGYPEEIIDAVYDLLDGCLSLDFLQLDELVNGQY